ncbi:TlpA family protein disulfide reductase [Chitinophagaceae bacterium LB-8]|uniref:TlpA family protein disulfide reductase n=1 Tax=Paraflavisolibacter caeni TaxID=2982496 RepID=A0A9X2XPW0_9BACT|nr:TlpA disulfide reductase family protein [Paraflavisolibacter caeni]MCU7551954.1 TlpA family protein disulfide reductase [Paraflavisolibacter caeni]
MKPNKSKRSQFNSSQLITLKIDKPQQFDSLSKRLALDSFVISTFAHFPEQYYYQQKRAERISDFLFSGASEYYGIDTTLLSYDPELDAETIFIVGKRNEDCIVIPDYNNNNVLSDDKPIIIKKWFSKNDTKNSKSYPEIRINNLNGFYDGKHFTFSQQFRIRPLIRDTILLSGQYKILELSLSLDFNEFYSGKFKANGHFYKVGLRNFNASALFNDKTTFIGIAKYGKKYEYEKSHDLTTLKKIGDTIKIKKDFFELSRVLTVEQGLLLRKLPLDKQIYSDNIWGDFSFTDLLTSDTVHTKSLLSNAKYLFIDFWGSWCKPCIAGLPDLIEFKKELSGKGVAFVGIAYDKEENVDMLKDIITTYKIEWPQSFIPMNSSYSLIKKYNVQYFPSFLLIDSENKIIYRAKGMEGLERIKQVIETMKF